MDGYIDHSARSVSNVGKDVWRLTIQSAGSTISYPLANLDRR